jgi:hypothetical protein
VPASAVAAVVIGSVLQGTVTQRKAGRILLSALDRPRIIDMPAGRDFARVAESLGSLKYLAKTHGRLDKPCAGVLNVHAFSGEYFHG